MFEKEEEKLQEAREHYQDVKIPDNLDEYIFNGVQKAKTHKQRVSRMKWPVLAASILLVAFLTSIRVSPVFAQYVSHIPGFEKIVELVRFDKGLLSAIENDFLQPVNVSDEHEGIKITVDSIIVDEEQMFVYYTVETDRDYDDIFLRNITFKENYEPLGMHYGSIMGLKKGEPVSSDIGFGIGEEVPDQLTLQLGLAVNPVDGKEKELDSTWEIPFEIDKEKFEGLREEYEVNEAVEVGGQKITFEKLTVLPTRIAVEVSYAEENTKEILGFNDLRIVNGKGEDWTGIRNGVIGHETENGEVIYLQSNFFTKPEEIYIQFSSIRALDKNELEVIVDPVKEEILKAPKDGIIAGIKNNGNSLLFDIKMNANPSIDYSGFGFKHTYKDSTGKEFESNGTGTHMREDVVTGIDITLSQEPYKGPLTFKLWDYPNALEKDIKIKVK